MMTAPVTRPKIQCDSTDPRNGGQVIIQDPTAPVAVAVDSTGIYWTSFPPGGKLGFVRKRAANSTEWTTLADKQNGTHYLVADNVHLYWVTNDNRIMRIAKSGGSPSIFRRENSSISRIAVDEANIYWAQGENPRQIAMAPKKGGPKQILAKVQADLDPTPLALTSERVFWTSYKSSYELQSVSKRGGEVVNHGKIDAYGAKGNIVYWTADRELFYKIGDAQPLRIPVPQFVADDVLMADGDFIFGSENAWTMKGAHPSRVWRASIRGGCSEIIANLPGTYFNNFTVFDGKVYWPDHKEGAIYQSTR